MGEMDGLGIRVTESFKVLGFVIDRHLRKLDENWLVVIEKVKKKISFWKRECLTPNGRIAMAKTFIISQIT